MFCLIIIYILYIYIYIYVCIIYIYMYVHIYNCYFFSPLYNVINCRNFRKMLWNEKRQQYITCQMYSERPRRVFVSSYYALEGRRFKRTDTSMRSINKSSQKIWACIWHTRTTTPQLIQTILTQKRLDFFMLYKVGGGKVGGGKVGGDYPFFYFSSAPW